MVIGAQICKAIRQLRRTRSSCQPLFLGHTDGQRRTVRCKRQHRGSTDVAARNRSDRDKSQKRQVRHCQNQRQGPVWHCLPNGCAARSRTRRGAADRNALVAICLRCVGSFFSSVELIGPACHASRPEMFAAREWLPLSN